MRTWLNTAVLMAPLLTAAAAQAGLGGGPAEPIVIGRPAAPTRQTLRVEGDCGAARFGIALDYQHEDAARRLRSLTVNGGELSAAARQQVVGRLGPGMWIMRATIDQCDGADRGRFRLTVSERRQRAVVTRFFDFWVAPDGSVSGVRFN